MSLQEIYKLTPTELFFLVKFNGKQNHNEMVERYEMMRLQTYLVLQPFTKLKSPQQLLKFVWDEDIKEHYPTQEEIQEYQEKYSNLPFPLLKK